MGMLEQVEKRQKLRSAQREHEHGQRAESPEELPARRPRFQPLSSPHHAEEHPGEEDDLWCAGQHLHRGGQRREGEGASAFAPADFRRAHDPGHPAQRRDVVRPHQRIERETIEGKRDAGHRRARAAARPTKGQPVHAHPGQPEMREAEGIQRPRHREQQVEQRAGVERERVPLREEGQAEIVERIPQRHFAAPEAIAMKQRQRIAEQTKVAVDEGLQSEGNFGKGREDQQRERGGKTPQRPSTVRTSMCWS